MVSTGAKSPHQFPGLALLWWILEQGLQPDAGHLLKDFLCTKHELFLLENYKTKQYEKSVLKQCGLNLLYGGEAVQEMFDSIAFALT